MCARYTVFTEDEIIEMRAIIQKISEKFGYEPSGMGEVYPTNTAPILLLEKDILTPILASFGFRKTNSKTLNINARTDTIINALDNPQKHSMWREPILTRRCVVPSTGFYEWTRGLEQEPQISLFPIESSSKKNNPQVKLLFHRPKEEMLYIAGMVSSYMDKDGSVKDAFVILTTAANPDMAPYHDRMPVILESDECVSWIKSDKFMRSVLIREGLKLQCKIAG